MYADDSSLYCTSADSLNTTRIEVGVSLLNDLENVLKWGHDWLVTFNAMKTKLLSMFRSRNRSFHSVHMGSSTLTESSELQLLGLDISSNLRWDNYISGIAKSASKRVGCLYRAQRYLPPDAVFLPV